MNLSEAKEVLAGCIRSELRDHAFGDTEVLWLKDGKQVAAGYFGRDADVWFSSEDGPSTDSFTNVEARELRNCGVVGVVERNDETGPDEFVEGQIMPGLTAEAVLEEITTPPIIKKNVFDEPAKLPEGE